MKPDGIVILGTTRHSDASVRDFCEASGVSSVLRVHSEDMVFTEAIKKHVPSAWRHVLMLRDGFAWDRNVDEVAKMIDLVLDALELDGLLLAEPGGEYPCPGMILCAPHIVARSKHRPRIRFFRPDVAKWAVPPDLSKYVTRDETSRTGLLH